MLLISGSHAADLAALERLRNAYEREKTATSKSVQRLYMERLKRLKAENIAATRYEEAAVCHQEIERIAADLGDMLEKPLELVLASHEAELEGTVATQENPTRGLVGWSGSANTAHWKLPGLPSGGYEVWVEHSPAANVTALLREAYFHVERSLASEASESGLARTSLGNLRITRESGKLTLSLSGKNAQAVRVQRLILIAHAP